MAAPPLDGWPIVVGHRGAAGYAPENTLAGVRVAKALGAAWVEVDVKLTADNAPILIHDDDLDRTTSGAGPVADLALDAIQSLDAGGWFSERFAGEAAPKLEDFIALSTELDLAVNLEIKPSPNTEVGTAEAALEAKARAWTGRSDQPLWSSFQRASLRAIRERDGSARLGLLAYDLPDDWDEICAELACEAVHLHYARIDRDVAENVISAGYRLAAFTVNEPEEALRLARLGVGMLFSDYPDRIFAAFGGESIIRPERSEDRARRCVNGKGESIIRFGTVG